MHIAEMCMCVFVSVKMCTRLWSRNI